MTNLDDLTRPYTPFNPGIEVFDPLNGWPSAPARIYLQVNPIPGGVYQVGFDPVTQRNWLRRFSAGGAWSPWVSSLTGTAPTLTSAVQSDANVAITLTFSSAIDPAFVPAPSDFLAIANFVGKAPLSVTISGSTVKLTFDAAYSVAGITVGYTPGTVPLRGVNGMFVEAFANYPVAAGVVIWNPADLSNVTLSNGNLTAACTNVSTSSGVRANAGKTSGKYYFESTMTGWTGGGGGIGLCLLATAFDNTGFSPVGTAGETKSLGGVNGSIWVNGANSGSALGARAAGNIIACAVDLTARLAWFRASPAGSWNATSGTANDPAAGTGGVSIAALSGALYPCYRPTNLADICTVNFGASAFSGAVPSGFTAGWPA